MARSTRTELLEAVRQRDLARHQAKQHARISGQCIHLAETWQAEIDRLLTQYSEEIGG